jgi:hypothetical protein
MKTAKILLLAAMLLPFLCKAEVQQSSKTHHHLSNSRAHKNADTLVRGVSFEDFKKSVSDFSDSTKKILADTAWMLWKSERWSELEQFFKVNNLNGGWPPNRGALSLKIVTLKSGLLVDRYGGYYDAGIFQDKGTFVSLKGVPFPKRALPDKTLSSPYRVYRIAKPIAGVKKGGIIPWFGKPGLGVQYELPYNINDLKKGGYLEEEPTSNIQK